MYLNVKPVIITLLYLCMTKWTIKYVTGLLTDDELSVPEGSFSSYSLEKNDYNLEKSDYNSTENIDSEELIRSQYAVNKAWLLIERLRIERFYKKTDCQIMMPDVDENMPIPFFFHTKPSKIITPDRNGIVNIRHNTYFRFSCVKNEFIWPYQPDVREITVKCLRSNLVRYKNQTHFFEQFKCISTPIPKLVHTSKKCQGSNTTSVLRIGFQTEKTFLNLYRLCFDTERYNPLYAWYQIATPKYLNVQSTASSKIIEEQTSLYRSKSYKNFTMPDLYRNQANSVLKIMLSSRLTKFYIVDRKGEVRFLVPGQLIHRKEFSYHFQQQATYFYENTIPVWYKFQINMYQRINDAVSLWLARKSSRKYLVVSGSHNTFTLHNEKIQRRKIYLKLPQSVRVPQFYWKMVYDYNSRRGLVFIALNTAFTTYIKERRMCASTLCPGFTSHDEYARAFIYCCSKESFESAYGTLDPYVYLKF